MSRDRTEYQAQDRIFYDGDCGLCHAAVRFVITRMPSRCTFRFSPLAGETFLENVEEKYREGLPDTIVVQTSEGELLIRSVAAIYIMKRLAARWRWVGSLFSLVPRRMADAIYDLVARNRFRLFARPDTTCPVLPEGLRKCIDP